jgi:hypothetical protein
VKKKRRQLPVIGWREWASLPELGIDHIKVKIDTGARSSALHAYGFHRFDRDGEAWLRFLVHPIQRDAHTTVECEARMIGERRVRPSTGRATLRPVIVTPIRLGERAWPIEITLIRRDVMGFRMLLGRQAVRRRFLVHAGRSFLQSEKLTANRVMAVGEES